MSEVNYSEVLLDTIDKVVTERLKTVQYDRTVTCQIVEAIPDENKYWVNYNGLKLQVNSLDASKQYSEGATVYVLIPNGDYENEKIIVGGYDTQTLEKRVYANIKDKLVPNVTISMISLGEDSLDITPTKNQDSPELQVELNKDWVFGAIPYDHPYDYVGVNYALETNSLFDANNTQGEYSIIIEFGKMISDIFYTTTTCEIKSTDIYGNPYCLSSEFEQYAVFPYTKNIEKSTHIRVKLKQNNNFQYDDPMLPEIKLCSLSVSFGYNIDTFQEGIYLYGKNGEALTYKNADNQKNKNLYIEWQTKDRNNKPVVFNNYNDTNTGAAVYLLQYQEGSGFDPLIKELNLTQDELYNWKKVSSASFNYNFSVSEKTSFMQYKALILPNGQKTPLISNSIIYENLDPVAAEPGSSIIQLNNMGLQFGEGNSGVYNLYGLDNCLTDTSKQGPYAISFKFYDDLEDQIIDIEWTIPEVNTMILDKFKADRNDFRNILLDPEKSPEDKKDALNQLKTIQYYIKPQYSSSSVFNTIQCNVTLTNGEIRIASLTLSFGTTGEQSLEYAFNIEITGAVQALTQNNEKLEITPILSNQKETIDIEKYKENLEWSWVFPEKPLTTDNIITSDTIGKIWSDNNIGCQWSKTSNCAEVFLGSEELGHEFKGIDNENYSILKAVLKNYQLNNNIVTDLIAYLCIPVASTFTNDDITIEPSSIQGATRIIYNSTNTEISYSSDYYTLFSGNSALSGPIMSQGETESQTPGISWWVQGHEDGYIGLPALTISKHVIEDPEASIQQYEQKFQIDPSTKAPSELLPIELIAKYNNANIVWRQPILVLQNTWLKDKVDPWKDVLDINGETDKGSIVSPLLIAGTVNNEQKFTGVTLGQIAVGNKTRYTGIYGFKNGKTNFWLDDTGSLIIGGCDTPFYVTSEGTLYSKNAVLDSPSIINYNLDSGTIGGWNYSVNGIHLGNAYSDSIAGMSSTDNNYAFWAGFDKNSGFTKFRVSSDGQVSLADLVFAPEHPLNLITGETCSQIMVTQDTDKTITENNILFKTHNIEINANEVIFDANNVYTMSTWYFKNDQADEKLIDSEELIDKYDNFFNSLRPKRYKYKDDINETYHIGFVAQEINNSLSSSELSSQDFAGIFTASWPHYQNTEELKNIWQLQKDEIIALNTWQIQKLKNRVTELENEIKELKQNYEI